MSEQVVVRHFGDTDWVDEAKIGKVSAEMAAAAAAVGAKRKMMAQGDTGLYVQYSDLPAGYRIEPHTHSHGEVIYVLSGEANVDGGTVLKPNDSICIPGNFRYGITVGAEGLTMLTIRAGDATSNFKS